ncbi:thioredoxin domain-containing protein [Aquibacillus halophilus]|uniref:Thioredoxin domain-containing protein n=1 Tax=Aquibacillus halophilus TaxID=930132 RepID=A0A6A8DD13_9BACI|nr:DsbA family protein [Aquibacillus halophilus]MRH43575.1 thioredoxin domain-containing protein [Aquibacillus halophilus]
MAKRKNSPFKMAVIITLVIFAAMTALVVISTNNDSNTETSFEKQPPIDGQPILGDPNAPVTVVEFGDFKCPACNAWGESIFPQLVNDYVDTGKVKFAYINVLFHGKESELASLSAEAVYEQSPENYWTFHKELFNAQPPMENHDELWITNEKLLDIASNISGIDTQQLQEDIENQTTIEKVNLDSALVEEFDVSLTPTIMVNGTMLEDPFDYEKIKSLIEQELEGK